MNITATNTDGKIMPGFGFNLQADSGSTSAADFLNFRLLNQVRFQHLADNLGNTGGCQLCQARKIDTRNRTKLINQAINGARVGLLDLIDMPWLTISNHLVLPYFRASK